MKELSNGKWFARGLKAGIPIGLGYLAVAFTLGISARGAASRPFRPHSRAF